MHLGALRAQGAPLSSRWLRMCKSYSGQRTPGRIWQRIRAQTIFSSGISTSSLEKPYQLMEATIIWAIGWCPRINLLRVLITIRQFCQIFQESHFILLSSTKWATTLQSLQSQWTCVRPCSPTSKDITRWCTHLSPSTCTSNSTLHQVNQSPKTTLHTTQKLL